MQPNVNEARIVFGTFVACRIMHTVRTFSSRIVVIRPVNILGIFDKIGEIGEIDDNTQ